MDKSYYILIDGKAHDCSSRDDTEDARTWLQYSYQAETPIYRGEYKPGIDPVPTGDWLQA